MRHNDIFFAVGLLCVTTCRGFAATGCAEFHVEEPRRGGTPVVSAADFGFSETNDFNSAAVNRAIEHCRRIGAHTLELAPGTYRCFDAPGGIAITNMTDFTFDGRGALLIYRRPAEFRSQPQSELIHEYANVLVKGCERVKVCNIKMDWDWDCDPLGCFCVCDAVHVDGGHENASYVDMVLTDFVRHPKYPEPVPVQKIQSMAASHDMFGKRDHWHFGLTEGHFGSKNEWIGPNRLRIWPCVKHPGRNYNPRNDVHFSPAQNIGVARQFKVGDTYRLQHYYYGKNGFNLVSNRHLTLRDVDVWSCFGMAIVIDGKEKYTHIENVRVMPRPDAPYRRPYANANDAIHVARSSGYMKIVNCRVTFNNDDTLNLHDRFTIASRCDVRALEIVNERGIGYFRPDVGDPIELRHPDWRPTGYRATLVGIDGDRLILDRDIPAEIGDNFFVFDRAYGTDNVIVRGCTFENTSHRSLFSPSNLTIENCVFRRTGGRPIWIIADARKRLWCEGMGETNIVIRNNLFEECPHIDRDTPVISTSFVSVTPWKTGPLDPDFIKDILIEGNTIVDPYGPALKLEAGSDITFRNNEIRFTRPPFAADSGALQNIGAHNVTIENNRFVTNSPPVSVATGCAEFWVQKPRGDGTPVVRAADFGFSTTNDFNAAAINRAIEHCRRIGAHTLELDEGTYNCFDAPRGIALTNMTDFTFDGRGAILIFRRPAEFRCQPQSELIHENANLLVKDCERVKVCDFKMDWDWDRDPLACFCRCTDVHVDEHVDNASYVDLLFTDFERHPKYPAPVPVQAMRPMSESRTAFGPGPVWHFGLSEGHWGAKSEWLAPNRLRIRPGVKAEGKPYNPASDFLFSAEKNRDLTRLFRKGQLYRLQHYYYGKNGINMVGNRHLTMQEIDVWSCFGMGMVVDGKQEYWQIENVRIEPRPDAPYKRPVSSVSDAYHVARSHGHAKHLNMRIRLNNDDAMNFHDRFAIAKRTGPRALEIAMNRGIGYFRPEVGDPFELRHLDWRPTGFKATLARVEGETMILDRDIPDPLQGAFFVFDRAYGTDNILLRNCTFEDTPHRNLFSSSNLTIEDCIFNRVGSFPVRIIADARTLTWCEGLGETNIVIRNNAFVDTCRLRRPDPVFSTVLMKQIPWKSGPDDPNFMRDILIEKNILVDPTGPTALFEAGSDILFRNNEIRFTRQPFSAESGTIINVGATNVVIEENRTLTNAPPVTVASLRKTIRAASKAPLYGGIYDKEDPPPADRAKALAEMAAIRPSTVSIERRKGRNVLLLDGNPTPLNQYKGFTDYRLMGECGGNMVITFNRGQRLFKEATFDKADYDPKTGTFDFSRIEDTLLRIHAANPKARVFINVELDPDNAFLERNPDSIFLNEKGVRGRSNFQAFSGFDSSPLDPKNKRMGWAFSYTSAAWRAYVENALAKLCAYLKTTPAANIVIGFHLSGGMDGQFVQWQYGPENGHFDYSESNRRALCAYLRELYGTDAALQQAWGDPNVTLMTARNPSVAEFKSRRVFDDRPGFGRRLADCRRFVAVGPARALNGFARKLKREFGRPCLVETWYTSTIWSQPGRLALDDLIKDGGVDVICTVSGYSKLRALDGVGASANNSIAGLNLRGLLFVQEMDHRTWRTQHTGGFMSAESVAMPKDAHDFANQVRRDAGSVIAAGGAGFHLFDMFGSWYHGSKVKPAIREIYALNTFATAHAGEYPFARVAIFTDEKARLLRDTTIDAVNVAWRTSGVMPAIHYLSDLDNPALPEYDLYVVYSPVTITAAQTRELRRRTDKAGKLLVAVGPVALAGCDFADSAAAIAAMRPKNGMFVRREGERDLTPEALNAWACSVGVLPYAEPGNATYVGNGVAVVHRLKGPVRVDFGHPVVPVNPLTGEKGNPLRIWEPDLPVGSSAAICYLENDQK